MRFRQQFQWVQLFSAIIWMGVSYMWIHKSSAAPGIRGAYLISAILWMFVSILSVASYLFAWWQVGEIGLVQHRLWDTRTVPWNEITRVGPWKPMYRWLEVDYARAAPMSDRGSLHLLLAPADRNRLILGLRAHAAQADFDFFPSR